MSITMKWAKTIIPMRYNPVPGRRELKSPGEQITRGEERYRDTIGIDPLIVLNVNGLRATMKPPSAMFIDLMRQ